jgi:hypothetical protein
MRSALRPAGRLGTWFHLSVLFSLMLGLLPSAPSVATASTSDVPTSTAAAAAAQPVRRDVRFGVNEVARGGMPDVADRAGAGWSRITFWWSSMQPGGPDEFNMFATDQDAHINQNVERGRQLTGVVLNVPGWASSDGSANGVPRNLDLPWDHPDNHWGRFMERMARHYRGRIDTWIIWNEVDIAHGQWSTWNGSLEQYMQLLRVAARSIRAGNPDAKVLPFGAAWWYDRGATIERMLDMLAADPEARALNYYVDAVNLHLYSRADDIPTIVAWYRQQLASRGIAKPIWISEMRRSRPTSAWASSGSASTGSRTARRSTPAASRSACCATTARPAPPSRRTRSSPATSAAPATPSSIRPTRPA